MTSHDCGSEISSESIPLTGRRRELAGLIAALERRQSRLILGPPGSGKTRLVDEALARAGVPFARVRRSSVLHDLLLELALQLRGRSERSSGAGRRTSVSLKGAILTSLRLAPRCIVVEDVAGVEPRMYRFLQEIYYLPGCCLLVTATSRLSLGHLRKLLWDPREEISLGPLDGAEARCLFDQAVHTFRLESLDLDDFRRKVLAAARGNPGQIVAMCRLAGRPEYRSGRHVKFLPLRIDALTCFIR
jgi:hypothetical protein